MVGQTQGHLPALLNSGASRTTIFCAVLDELQGGPAIIVCEDVHWADEATLDLLRFLGRRMARTRALLVLTYRDDELGPRHPLRTVLGDLAALPVTRRIPLLPLTETAVRTLSVRVPLMPLPCIAKPGAIRSSSPRCWPALAVVCRPLFVMPSWRAWLDSPASPRLCCRPLPSSGPASSRGY